MKKIFVALFFVNMFSATIAQDNFKEEGRASYYADDLIGKATKNGELYDPSSHTAAHAKLPFGTMVKVTNIENGKSVVVKINDRFSSESGKIIILSKAAAQETGIIYSGTANVRLEAATPEAVSKSFVNPNVSSNITIVETTAKPTMFDMDGKPVYIAGYGVQLGSYSSLSSAKDFVKKLQANNLVETDKVFFQESLGSNQASVFRVIYGKLETSEQADVIKQNLEKAGVRGLVKNYKSN